MDWTIECGRKQITVHYPITMSIFYDFMMINQVQGIAVHPTKHNTHLFHGVLQGVSVLQYVPEDECTKRHNALEEGGLRKAQQQLGAPQLSEHQRELILPRQAKGQSHDGV